MLIHVLIDHGPRLAAHANAEDAISTVPIA